MHVNTLAVAFLELSPDVVRVSYNPTVNYLTVQFGPPRLNLREFFGTKFLFGRYCTGIIYLLGIARKKIDLCMSKIQS